MPYADCWAALNLQMPPRVPRTEYSVEGHWPLLSRVTGISVDEQSPPEVKLSAQREFFRKWNFGLHWNTHLHAQDFGEVRTRMGHAEYASGGGDFNSTVSCPFSSPQEVLAFDPIATYGQRDASELTRRFEADYARQVERYPDSVCTTGIYVTTISGLLEIFGWDMLLLAAGEDPDGFGRLTQRYQQWIEPYFRALAASSVPSVMIHDDIVWTSGPFIAPDWYRKYVFPGFKRLFSHLVDAGKRLLFTSDGNYSLFIDDIVACGPHALVMEPDTDMAYIASRYGSKVAFIGNADTRILLSGTREQIRAEVERCMAIGKSCPGFIMAVGNHIPANTPIENATYYNEVYDELSRR